MSQTCGRWTHRLGVLAFGDSITNGGGELQWGVALQSWALWTARGLGLPYTGCAVDGATAAHVVRRADPAVRARDRRARRALRRRLPVRRRQRRARLRTGTPAAYERDLRAALAFLRERCDRVLACTLPLDLGRPRAGARGGARRTRDRARRGGRRRARRRPARLRRAQPRDGRRGAPDGVRRRSRSRSGRSTCWPRDGMAVRVRPSTLIAYETTRWRRLRGDATYVYRQAQAGAADAAP